MKQIILILLVLLIGFIFWQVASRLDNYAVAQTTAVPQPASAPESTSTPTPTPMPTPIPRIDIGSKVVIVEKQLVYESQEALHKGREIFESGKTDAQIDKVINRMIKDGECVQLKRFMRATIVDIQGDDVQIRQGEPGPYAAKWW